MERDDNFISTVWFLKAQRRLQLAVTGSQGRFYGGKQTGRQPLRDYSNRLTDLRNYTEQRQAESRKGLK